jgi:hypothetical protein
MNDYPSGYASAHRTLVPFTGEERISVGEAAMIAGKSERTLRNWCDEHGIGRRIAGGPWAVSEVALAMLLDGDLAALAAYRDRGARASSEPVAAYYQRRGLAGLAGSYIRCSRRTCRLRTVPRPSSRRPSQRRAGPC